MKIIYDNIIFSLQKAGGISVYWYELTKRMKIKENITFFESENKNIFRQNIDLDRVQENNLSVKLLRYFPFLKKLPSLSVFHSSYYRVSLQKDIVNITTVHDFTYEYFRTGLAKYIHIWQKRFSINRSDGIICVSENTKKDLLKFHPRLDSSKIKVIYNGVGSEFEKLDNARECLNNKFEVLKNKIYIVYIGDRSRYKNFDIAIKVLEKLGDYNLVVVGGQDFNAEEKDMIKTIQNRIYHFKGMGGEKLNTIYNNAFCLLYPSSYEGFGIPILEAMRAGCPVVSTNRSSIPEIAGNAGLLVNDISVENFIIEMKRLENDIFRKNMINKGLIQAENFSWDICFEETLNFYREVYKKDLEKINK